MNSNECKAVDSPPPGPNLVRLWRSASTLLPPDRGHCKPFIRSSRQFFAAGSGEIQNLDCAYARREKVRAGAGEESIRRPPKMKLPTGSLNLPVLSRTFRGEGNFVAACSASTPIVFRKLAPVFALLTVPGCCGFRGRSPWVGATVAEAVPGSF
jgi:hypothetical protein